MSRTLNPARASKFAQIPEQIEVVDDAWYFVLGAEAAAATHPFGEGTAPDDTDFRCSHSGAMSLVIEISADQFAIESLGKRLSFQYRDRPFELDNQ